jgi:hypothetical protein
VIIIWSNNNIQKSKTTGKRKVVSGKQKHKANQTDCIHFDGPRSKKTKVLGVNKMKKTLLAIIALALMAGTAASVDLIADGGDPLTKFDAGDVTVTNDATNLIVTYTITTVDPPWKIVGTSLGIDGGIVVTGKGNPKVGKFTAGGVRTAMTHGPAVTTYTYTIPLASLNKGDGETVTIAAHAAIEYTEITPPIQVPNPLYAPEDPNSTEPEFVEFDPEDIVHSETAWGGTWIDTTGDDEIPSGHVGTQLTEGRNWAASFTYTIIVPVVTDP